MNKKIKEWFKTGRQKARDLCKTISNIGKDDNVVLKGYCKCAGCATLFKCKGDPLCPSCRQYLIKSYSDDERLSEITGVTINFENCASIVLPGKWILNSSLTIIGTSDSNDADGLINMTLIIYKRANTYIEDMHCTVFERLSYGDIVSIDVHTISNTRTIYIPYRQWELRRECNQSINLGFPNIYQSSYKDSEGNLTIKFYNNRS